MLVFLVYVLSLASNHMRATRDARMQRPQPYDLMTDALARQNITRHTVSCPLAATTTEENDRTDRQGSDTTTTTKTTTTTTTKKPLSDKYELFRDFYMTPNALDADTASNVAAYPLNLTSYFSASTLAVLSPHLATFIDALSLCSIRAYRAHFVAKKIHFGSGDVKFFDKLRSKNFDNGN